MRVLLLVALLSASGLAGVAQARCLPPATVAKRLARASFVFEGEALEQRPGAAPHEVLVKVKVGRVFKAETPLPETVELVGYDNREDAPLVLEQAHHAVIYARGSAGETLGARYCDGTIDADWGPEWKAKAEKELRALTRLVGRGAVKAPTPTSP